ncbi:hypothetical protein NDU88_008202, partial [Pleurodeles waltl]
YMLVLNLAERFLEYSQTTFLSEVMFFADAGNTDFFTVLFLLLPCLTTQDSIFPQLKKVYLDINDLVKMYFGLIDLCTPSVLCCSPLLPCSLPSALLHC